MIVQCSNCGAPLDVLGSETHVQCKYCGLSNQVRKMKTLHAITPVGWTAPPTWTPQAPPQVYYPPVYPQVVAAPAAAAGTSMVGCAIAGVVVLMVAAGVMVPLMQSGVISAPWNSWDGTGPFRCGGNDSVRISGVTANLPRDTAITVEANCELEIVDSNITAWQGIEAGGNRRVVIRNSTIRATGTGIRADGNKHIELINSTVIASGGPGVEASGIAHVLVEGGRVEGTPLAITTDALARAEVRAGGQLVNSLPPMLPGPDPGGLGTMGTVGDKN